MITTFFEFVITTAFATALAVLIYVSINNDRRN